MWYLLMTTHNFLYWGGSANTTTVTTTHATTCCRFWMSCVRRTTGVSQSTSCTRPSDRTRDNCSSTRSPSRLWPHNTPTCKNTTIITTTTNVYTTTVIILVILQMITCFRPDRGHDLHSTFGFSLCVQTSLHPCKAVCSRRRS